MDSCNVSAMEQVFAIPELLEHILTFLLNQLHLLTDHEDPRSVRVHSNARVLQHLLCCTEVSRAWQQCILGSNRLKRALFLLSDFNTCRSWVQPAGPSRERRGLLGNYYIAPCLRAPQLNPVIQRTFPKYQFRFWHLNLERHCAYLIVTRRNVPAVHLRALNGQGRSISSMLLSQPPCFAAKASIWEERDEVKDYTGKTSALNDPMIHCDQGITLGMVHSRIKAWFDQYPDVTAIKITTV